ncbi:MAG: aminotransferase class V-fold PLP-dependent enzyme [Candidatus Aminicenantes bacterium]|nr:aminotransferase class V-fold PLP-dependent enzyme [Candidatus Aminicenantes bacterium]
MNERDSVHPLEILNPKVRARFPMIDRDSRGNPRIYLNTGAGSLTVDTASEAAFDAQRRLNPMPGAVAAGEAETAGLHSRVRDLAAEFLHAGDGREISFHQSATAALFNLAYALRGILGPENNLVVTDLDHMANVSPWEAVWGDTYGFEIRRARVTAEGCLDISHLLSIVDAQTGLLAVTSASNGTGSLVPLRETIAAVRERAPHCLVAVDAVHHAPHGVLDVRAADCDFLVFSGYKVFGPMQGVLWGKAALLEKLRPYRVETNKNEPPWKFEMGMLNNTSLAALGAALEYLLWLADLLAHKRDSPLRETKRDSPLRGQSLNGVGPEAAQADRAAEFRSAMTAIAAYETGLTRCVLEGFRKLDPARFRLFGISDPSRSGERVPTFAFDVAGLGATETKKRLWEDSGLQIADGNHYSAAVVRHLGRPEGICRASFAHYDNHGTVDRFLETLRRLADK